MPIVAQPARAFLLELVTGRVVDDEEASRGHRGKSIPQTMIERSENDWVFRGGRGIVWK
jgi:hypothetical protein